MSQATTPNAVQATPRVPRAAILSRARSGGIIYPFIVLFIVLAIWKGAIFYGTTNLLAILDQQSTTLIIAAAGTLVLVAGGIDVSVGATYALAQVVPTKLVGSMNPVPAILIGIAVGLGVGLADGVVATFFRINSLIATLAMSFVVGGLASLVTGGDLLIAYSAPRFAHPPRTRLPTRAHPAPTRIRAAL